MTETLEGRKLALALPETIVKRDGRVVAFDIGLIENAISRCFASFNRVPETPVKELARRAVNIMVAKGQPATVENVQDIVEMVLQAAGEFEAAKRYILYRAEHARSRQDRPIPDEVRAAFDQSARYFPTQLQQFQFFDKYSRFDYKLGRRETWVETVNRTVDFLYELAGPRLEAETYERVRRGILEMKVTPSMRMLAMAGPAARRSNITIYNCSYQPVESIDSFVEALIISMSGCGVGFSVEREYIENFPRIRRQTGHMAPTFVVPDSAEGWADALRIGLQTWFDGGDIRFDLSQLRLAGAPLHTKGGRASGPEPLRSMLEFVRAKILARQGTFIRSLDAHDIMCMVGNAAVSGGVRRTAMISLFDYDDLEMRHSKNGDFERENSQRWNANNSAVWPEGGLNQVEVARQVLDMVDSGRGEPGIFNRQAALDMAPARRKTRDENGNTIKFGTNPCITGDTWVAVADGRGRVRMSQLVHEGKDVDVFSIKDDELVIRTMRNPRKTGTAVPIYRVDFTDGTSIRVTPNHKFILNSGEVKEAVNLSPNDSLMSMTTSCLGYDRDNKTTAANYDCPKTYRMLKLGNMQRSEHRVLYEHFTGVKLDNSQVLHHRDFDSLNNRLDNLVPMTEEQHNALHNVSGSNNPNALEVSNEQLEAELVEFVHNLGYRPSIEEYQAFARLKGLPQTFQNYRQDYFNGTLQETLTRVAEQLGVNQPPHVKSTVKASNLPIHYKGSIAYVTKNCECCGREFEVAFRQRETATCSYSCGTKLYYKLNGVEPGRQALMAGHGNRKEQRRQLQVTVYNDLVFELGRHPLKEEWQERCRERGISPEISRVSSPFRYWNELEEAAATSNHRVLSVEQDGYEDVYNGTVDGTHTFFAIGSERVNRNGRTDMSYVLSKNCGEIILPPWSFCNLSAVVARQPDTLETLKEKVELATIIGSIQSMATYFPGLRPMWQKNCEEERLLGVDITGQLDSAAAQDAEIKAQLRDYAIEVNKKVATQLGINQSASITCVKPSGNTSQLVDCASGLHARWSPYYIRNVRVAAHTPIYRVLKDAGVPMDPENGQTPENATTWVIHFPVKAPDGAITRNGRTAIEQCNYWLQNKLHWTEHNPSVTITYRPDEVLELLSWIWEHRTQLGGMAFLPTFDAQYAQLPYIEITAEEYHKLASQFPEIDFSKLYRHEEIDYTTAAQELACMSGSCEIDVI